MKQLFFLLIALNFLTSSCNFNNKKNSDKIEQNNSEQNFIISKHDSIHIAHCKQENIPPVIPFFYFDYNFLFDSSNNIFLHKKHPFMGFCDDGSCDKNFPPFMHLKPSDIIQIDENFIDNFLRDSIPKLNDVAAIAIVSFYDTVKSKQANEMIHFLIKRNETRKPIIRWGVRKITEEESIVLDYKKRNKPYSPQKIKWSKKFSDIWAVPKKKYFNKVLIRN